MRQILYVYIIEKSIETEKTIVIFQKSKYGNKWEDITDRVSELNFEGKAYSIRYKNNDTLYYKSSRDLIVCDELVPVAFENYLVIIRNTVALNIKNIYKSDDNFVVYYADGRIDVCNKENIELYNRPNGENFDDVLNYFKEVSKYIDACEKKSSSNTCANAEEKENNSFLLQQLNKLTISNSSVLGKLINNKLKFNKGYNGNILLPFDSNLSQKRGVENALTSDISVIQGPPGTGKTQTILNIAANLISRNASVAVLSGNNKAIENVAEKFADNDYGYMNAFLGRKGNIIDFFAKSNEEPIVWNVQDSISSISQKLNYFAKVCDDIYRCDLEIAKDKQIVSELTVEQAKNDAEYASKERNVPKVVAKKRFKSKKMLSLLALFEICRGMERVKFSVRANMFFRYGVRYKQIRSDIDDCIEYLKNYYYKIKIAELNAEIAESEKILKEYRNTKADEQYKLLSQKYFKASLNKRYSQKIQSFAMSDYKSDFKKFVKRYPIIYSTTHAIRSCSADDYLYDYAIIDESSQVDLITMLIAFSCARSVVLVGDDKQLPHVVKSIYVKDLNTLFSKYKLRSEWNYVTNNVLNFLSCRYKNLPEVLLNEHYRCDPQIIDFCNKRFYNGRLIIRSEHDQDNGLIIIQHLPHYAHDRKNQREVDIIDKEIIPNIKYSAKEVGITAPYNNQIDLLKSKYAQNGYLIDTIHKFQGKERDCVIVSCVGNKVVFYDDDERIDFLNNPNLINVAISRAKKKLYIVVSEQLLDQEGTILNDLKNYKNYYCDDVKIIKSNVYSVFDLMYDDYNPILESLRQRLLNISRHKSENIIATVIDDICRSNKFGALSYKFNYPLRNIVKLDSMVDEEDKKFVGNVNTHCDFVIYSALNKDIKLVVEVDGGQHEDVVQNRRDRRKDRILNCAGIKILRLPTNSIECEQRIKDALSDVCVGR